MISVFVSEEIGKFTVVSVRPELLGIKVLQMKVDAVIVRLQDLFDSLKYTLIPAHPGIVGIQIEYMYRIFIKGGKHKNRQTETEREEYCAAQLHIIII